jgi:ArsR family transcriptional regulator
MASILNSLKLLTDPTRLRILNLLSEESLSVAELQEILGMGQSRISTQLAQLRKAGLVEDSRTGKYVFYRLTIEPELEPVMTKACEELDEVQSDLKALHYILEKRKDKMRAYFDDVVGKFGRDYAPGRSWKALAGGLLRIMNYDVIADLGAGEGFVSQLLSARAKQVIAIDNSPRMVAIGTEMAKKHDLTNLEYRLGDIESPPIESNTVDLAMLSQALHHALDPVKALHAAWDILKPGGCLLILDLLKHSLEEARELYADNWLGFSELELESMLSEAGFINTFTDIVDKELEAPYFQTLMAVAWKPN